MRKPEQTDLLYVAPRRRPLSPSRQEMLRRAGTILSPGQQMAARRSADREEREHLARKNGAADPRVVAMLRGVVKRIGS